MSCGLCEAPGRGRPLLCPSCFAAASAGRHADLRALSEQRDAAQAAVEGLVADKELWQRQELALLRVNEDAARARARAAETERQLVALRARAAAVRADVAARQERLAEAQRRMGARAHATMAAEHAARERQATAAMRTMDALAREQRSRVVRRVLQILPLALVPPVHNAGGGSSAAASSAAAAAAPPLDDRGGATICGLPLPDSRASMGELAAAAGSLGSTLGYLALLLDLLSRLLQLPVPHRLAFQGSTSLLWQPDSFFDMRASPPNDALLLAWPRGADEHAWGGSGASGGGGGGSAAAQQQRARQEAQLRAALAALQRAAGSLVYARLGPDAPAKVPPDWSPFAWLAGLCQMLGAEPRPASARVGVPGARAHPLAASAVFGRYSPENGGMAQSVLLHDGGEEEEGEEGWEHLGQPMPPTPMETEDVEQWEAANFRTGGDSNGSGAAAAAAAFGTSPMARLRSLRSLLPGSLGGGG